MADDRDHADPDPRVLMGEWTPEAMLKEMQMREHNWKAGICPDSGKEVHTCHKSICDCFGAEDCFTCPR